MNNLNCPDISSNNNIVDTNTYENSKVKSINYNYYYQNNINCNNNYYNKSKDNFSNNLSTSSKNKNKNSIFIKRKLKLKNLFGDLFKENFVIIINENGIENFSPLRQKYDGVTKFGPVIFNNDNKNPINDFQIFSIEKSIQTIFMIKYDFEKRKYFLISNINNNKEIHYFNIFIKLEKELPIKQKYNISLGKANFSIEKINNYSLELKLYLDNGEIELYLFDTKKNLITIGRSKTCDIILPSLEYSRIHTSIYYNKKEQTWYIKDGIGDKKSMNGTWLFINFPWEISYNTKMRIGKNLLELNLI